MRLLLLSTALITAPLGVFAQDASGIVTLGYGNVKADNADSDVKILSLDGRAKIEINETIMLSATGSAVHLDDGDTDGSLSVIGAEINYKFTGGALVGAYVDHAGSGDIDGAGLTSYGLLGGYTSGPGTIKVFGGVTDSDETYPGIDIRDYGIIGNYQPNERTMIGGSFVQTTFSGYGQEEDLTFGGLAGAYGISPTLSAFGALTQTKIRDVDLTSVGLGVNYFFDQRGDSISLEVIHSDTSLDGDDGSETTLRLGLSIPFGNKGGHAIPKNSLADGVLNPSHNALSATVLALY